MKIFKLLLLGTLAMTALTCDKDDTTTPSGGNSENVDPGNDPNFTIIAHADEGLSNFDRKVEVFGVDIYAVSGVENVKLLHAANILAQYIDNDEDGEVDNPLVIDKMVANKAFIVMWNTEADFPDEVPRGRVGQDLGNHETRPEWHITGRVGAFDAALEEVWHIITHAGYSRAYPDVFGEAPGSSMADAMDIARGGQFMSIPNPYPTDAWYTYDDSTCDYACMATEYFYWAMTSMLGAQANRLGEIEQEWRLNTRNKVQQSDSTIFDLLSDPQYKFPMVLPDGTYRR